MRRAHEMPFGAEVTAEGVRFALWAPSARSVHLVLDGVEREMKPHCDGWYRLLAPEAAAGSRYAYRIDGELDVPDPASRHQPDGVHGPSVVTDPAAYSWSDTGWTGRPWAEAVLYELHVGTATPEGTFASLMDKLDRLRDVGITGIELLPIAEFPGRRNWGYDGVLPFAPASAYGTPDDLKRLVGGAHDLGLMVFLDVVYNHFGPSGNYLQAYAAPFFTAETTTPWGAAINMDRTHSSIVRNFFIHNAIYWLEEFHLDGLRFDAVHAIVDEGDPHFIAELATRIRAALPGREIHLVLENETDEARWLGRDAVARPLLHTAQWADGIHHAWHAVLTGENEGYYEDYAADPVPVLARGLAEGFAKSHAPSPVSNAHRGRASRGPLPPTAFVSFLQNHDQIGNRAFGERLSHLAAPKPLALAQGVHRLAPQVPLIFMGEEWAASTPFLYFVDYENDPDLAEAVRSGRRREFSRFKAFADPDAALKIPDPTGAAAFAQTRLRWEETRNLPHSDAVRETRRLLDLRQAEIVPLLKTDFLRSSWETSHGMIDVSWWFEGGVLRLLANLGGTTNDIPLHRPARAIWSSPGAIVGDDAASLPPWTAAFLKGAPP